MNTSTWIGVGLLIFFIIFGIVGSIIGFSNEKKSFNGGKCVRCNTKLRLFDFDSQGGRGYTCNTCNRNIWISYKRIDSDYLDDFFYGEVRKAVEEMENKN